MPIKHKKASVESEEKEDKDLDEVEELESEDEEEQEEEVAKDSLEEEAGSSEEKTGPKINFDYEYQDEDDGEAQPRKKEETLEDLANKYRGSDEEPEVLEEKETEKEIPQMRAQMPTSGIYSAQDIRRGNGDLHQAPLMRTSFSSHANGNNRPNRSSKLHFIILAIIGLAVLGSAVYLLKYQFKPSKPVPTSTPAPVVQATSTPAPTAAPIDRSKYTVRVLNGTGKSGLAATASTKLKDLGYKIDKTGNAASSDETTIKAKPNNDELIKQLIADLAADYKASSASASLKSSDAADAEVVLGGK